MTQKGAIFGSHDKNPKLNSIVHDIEFSNGQAQEHVANVIAENMLKIVDSEGFSITLICSIID